MKPAHKIVPHDAWVEERVRFLAQEKEFTRQRDKLSQSRRDLPWERVEKDYRFTGPGGPMGLAQIFGPRSQLIIYHFMLGPDWEEGCPSCSFWADNFNGIGIHLAHRDVTFAAISHAPLPKLDAYARRMGWSFPWYSSFGSDFNFDYQVSFTAEQLAAGEALYNYKLRKNTMSELPGISVFIKGGDEAVFHTYSCHSRGLDMLNGAYHYLDLTPKGRDEAGSTHKMGWVRRHDQYED